MNTYTSHPHSDRTFTAHRQIKAAKHLLDKHLSAPIDLVLAACRKGGSSEMDTNSMCGYLHQIFESFRAVASVLVEDGISLDQGLPVLMSKDGGSDSHAMPKEVVTALQKSFSGLRTRTISLCVELMRFLTRPLNPYARDTKLKKILIELSTHALANRGAHYKSLQQECYMNSYHQTGDTHCLPFYSSLHKTRAALLTKTTDVTEGDVYGRPNLISRARVETAHLMLREKMSQLRWSLPRQVRGKSEWVDR